MIEEFRKEGACASLNLTLNELMNYIDEPGPRNRGDLRSSVREMIADLAFEWLQYGFYLGHRESYRCLRDEDEIPATLFYEEGAWEVLPGCTRSIDLQSRIRRT